MEEKANNAIVGAIMATLKWLGRGAVRLTGRVIKSGARKTHENTKSYRLGSVKKLVKKQPNAGINQYLANDKDEYEYIQKQLNKSHQYFTASKEIGEDGKEKYTISTTKGNKDLAEYFREEYKNKQEQKDSGVKRGIGSIGRRRSLDKTFKTAEIGMKYQEEKRAAKQHEVQKHKDIKKDEKVL